MYYGHNLRSNLQEWRNRLYKSNYENINNNYRFFFSKIDESNVINAILQTAVDNYYATDEQLQNYRVCLSENGLEYDNEEEAASILYRIHKLLQKEGKAGRDLCFMLADGRDFDERFNRFFENHLEPIVNYIHDKLDEANYVLYLLEKYKKRTEWFLFKSLLAKYDQASQQYEQIFEDDLRLYLFDQGIDYPFSTPKSTAGRADIVGLIDTNNPLILEIKIYDTIKKYYKNRIIEGFSQIVKYSNDYNKNVGYLVVFNIDNVEIEVISEDADKTFPNKIIFNNKVYYIVFVNLNFDISASKTGKLKVVTITKKELTQELNET